MNMKSLVIMPFRAEFDAVFGAVRDAGGEALPEGVIHCYWLKEIHAAGKITDDIVHGLEEAAFCIADVTGNNPNVMWETGFAMALRKPTILIGQDVDTLPFNLKDYHVLEYARDRLDDLRVPLIEAIRQTLAKYEIGPQPAMKTSPGKTGTTIAVTGSMRAHQARAKQRVRALLSPYLSPGTLWYCGSNGTSDECVLEFLVDCKQNSVAVGYHRLDLSEGVRRLVSDKKVGFLDASLESLPKGLEGPSERDTFFAMKADLVILLWDGESKGTRTLIRYFEAQGRNLLIGFV
jgi:hypothetical protein